MVALLQKRFPWAENCERPPRGRRRPCHKRVDVNTVEFNQALWRIAKDEVEDGGIYEQLAILTGLTVEALWMRVSRIDKGPDRPNTLSTEDITYFLKRYARSNDPAVREWLPQIAHQPRRRKHGSKPRGIN